MKGELALLIFLVWFIWVLHRDTQERGATSFGIWIVLAWLIVHGMRPLSMWLGWDSSYSRDEGNPFEAAINLVLMLSGSFVLLRRTVWWSEVVKDNAWLFVFYGFWLMSVTWSDYPLITFKRLFKELGNVAMVLLILTEKEPSQAIRAVCVRFAYLSVPLSVVLIKYFPQWGRTFSGYHGDVQMYTGVTTHKNMLGIVVLVSVLFVLWDIVEQRSKRKGSGAQLMHLSRAVVFGMCWYLLFTIDSVTSLVCSIIGCVVLIALGLPGFRGKPARFELAFYGFALLLWVIDLLVNIKETIIVDGLGRNMTLTSRSDIWEVVQEFQDKPLVGQGFDTFWAGERLTLLADKTFGIIQAHNGYLETYLNGGWIGVALLVGLLLSAYWQVRKGLISGHRESHIRFVLILTALIHNYTEASFNKVGVLWFVTVFAIMDYRVHAYRRQLRSSSKNYAFQGFATQSPRPS